jgi:hypothetical protein
MNPKISVIFPTRERPRKLHRAIISYHDCCNDLDVWIYVHDDDRETQDYVVKTWSGITRVRWIIGRTWYGTELGPMHTALKNACGGEYIWLGNDDVVISGKVHPDQFRVQAIYQPEIHKLNTSTYVCDANCPFFIFHRSGLEDFDHPVDIATLATLRGKGWPIEYLRGLTVWHDRDEADCKRIMRL